jgi:thioredoxin 1
MVGIPLVTAGEFKDKILEAEKPAMVWFTVPNCPPCRAIASRVEEVAGEYGEEVLFYRLNIEEHAEKAREYNVTSTPTLIFFKGGGEIARLDAFPSKEEIIEVIKEIRR